MLFHHLPKNIQDSIEKDMEKHMSKHRKDDSFYIRGEVPTLKLQNFEETYGYAVTFMENGLVQVSDNHPYIVELIEKEKEFVQEIQLWKALAKETKVLKQKFDEVNNATNHNPFNYTYNPKHGEVVASGNNGGWYEFKDGTVKTYLQLLVDGVKF